MKMNGWMALAAALLGTLTASQPGAQAAENLRLAQGVSFISDAGTLFPISGDKMNDYVIEPGKPTLIFFGAAGDLNTNRQAKRVVQLYSKHKDETKFIIVNVDDPNPAARELVKKYYPGYVPAQLLIDRAGQILWSQVGEISRRKLSGQINNM